MMSTASVRPSGAALDYTNFYRYTGTNSSDVFQNPAVTSSWASAWYARPPRLDP